jgi:hypothetical protein
LVKGRAGCKERLESALSGVEVYAQAIRDPDIEIAALRAELAHTRSVIAFPSNGE